MGMFARLLFVVSPIWRTGWRSVFSTTAWWSHCAGNEARPGLPKSKPPGKILALLEGWLNFESSSSLCHPSCSWPVLAHCTRAHHCRISHKLSIDICSTKAAANWLEMHP
jgi:hypothetical protein